MPPRWRQCGPGVQPFPGAADVCRHATGPGWRLFPPTWSASAPEGGRWSNIAALSESGSAAWPASSVIEDSVPPPRRERRALASGRAVTLLEELEELNPFPQPALHHLRA